MGNNIFIKLASAAVIAVGGVFWAVDIHQNSEVCNFNGCYPDPAARIFSRVIFMGSLGIAGVILNAE